MPRFLRILYRPEATWREIRATDPAWFRSLLLHALPLALLPAVAWIVGQGAAVPGGPWQGLFATLLLALATVLLVALGLYVFAPMFGAVRHWDRSVALASYAATPVLLCGALLFMPVLVVASVGGFLFAIGLSAAGLPIMLDCRSRDVAAYLACCAVFLGVASTALGALCSAIGLI